MEEEEGRADGTQKVRGDGETERDDPASYPQRLTGSDRKVIR